METQLQQQVEQRHRVETDLMAVRDLCVKLDQQKDSLMEQLGDKDTTKAHVYLLDLSYLFLISCSLSRFSRLFSTFLFFLFSILFFWLSFSRIVRNAIVKAEGRANHHSGSYEQRSRNRRTIGDSSGPGKARVHQRASY
jgi:phosphoglycerol transferase MdoB-like AlkP superfamily enzyme